MSNTSEDGSEVDMTITCLKDGGMTLFKNSHDRNVVEKCARTHEVEELKEALCVEFVKALSSRTHSGI